ncbi:FAD-binding dehydrogenase [Haemophilus paracuniculus]|uniref:L-aspartate oxidase n=1 Tax=Haemophilus paracuniculus TaxID=734 RepID=A0A1T0AR73_9PAST|nr:FAD-binding protein [Haemophilus paracuniculus]OOR98792.1 FAD-binding dehydrogenase [Haemophilus paracuniculus]
MNKIHISQTIETDLLIIGSGIAGLACAVEAEQAGIRMLLATKTVIGSGASYFPLKATLGIQVTGGAGDIERFREDIERVACGQNNPKIVQAYLEDSPQAIDLLSKIGFEPWQRQDNRPACFAKYARPIFLINQWREAAKRAKQILAGQSTQILENATLVKIVSRENRVQGAVLAVQTSGQIRYLFCQTPHIILASGGIAGLYQHNLYPADVIGSTHFLAQQAGAKLVNLEFIQFIPAFVEPKYKVLFGEHTLKYVKKITDHEGKDLFPHLTAEQFAAMVQMRSDYAPFSVDFASVEFDRVIMQYLLENPQAKSVYLHYDSAIYQDQTEFYRVYLQWLSQEVGIDLVRDPIAIAPFAHSCNGGIEIDEFGESAVQGLFAVGEVSACIEGANRLGGNSVGGGLVFARRAVAKITERQKFSEIRPLAEAESLAKTTENQLNQLANPNADPNLTASEVLQQIRTQMARFANVYRTEANLTQLLAELGRLEQQFCPITHHYHQGLEIYHALKTAQAVVSAMLNRKQSLGSHFRADDQGEQAVGK